MVPAFAEGFSVDAPIFLVSLLAGHRAEEIPVAVLSLISCMGFGVASSSLKGSMRFVFDLVRNTAWLRQVAAHGRVCRCRALWAAIDW